MMRTIKEKLLQRLVVQASEAELQGRIKIASALTEQIVTYGSAVRPNDADYSYPEQDFKRDVVNQFWGAVIRIADYYDISRLDAADIEKLIDKTAEDMIADLCARAGIKHGVGAYEDSVPGEVVERVGIEVDEEDS